MLYSQPNELPVVAVLQKQGMCNSALKEPADAAINLNNSVTEFAS